MVFWSKRIPKGRKRLPKRAKRYLKGEDVLAERKSDCVVFSISTKVTKSTSEFREVQNQLINEVENGKFGLIWGVGREVDKIFKKGRHCFVVCGMCGFSSLLNIAKRGNDLALEHDLGVKISIHFGIEKVKYVVDDNATTKSVKNVVEVPVTVSKFHTRVERGVPTIFFEDSDEWAALPETLKKSSILRPVIIEVSEEYKVSVGIVGKKRSLTKEIRASVHLIGMVMHDYRYDDMLSLLDLYFSGKWKELGAGLEKENFEPTKFPFNESDGRPISSFKEDVKPRKFFRRKLKILMAQSWAQSTILMEQAMIRSLENDEDLPLMSVDDEDLGIVEEKSGVMGEVEGNKDEEISVGSMEKQEETEKERDAKTREMMSLFS